MATYDVRNLDMMARAGKGWRTVVKQALQDMMLLWHEKYAPLHFKKTAYIRYGDTYKRRYQKLRAGKRPSVREPMVASGAMRALMLQVKPKVSGSSRRVRARLAGTRVANYHAGNNPSTGGYNMIKELRVINAQEMRMMIRYVEDEIVKWLDSPEIRSGQMKPVDEAALDFAAAQGSQAYLRQ